MRNTHRHPWNRWLRAALISGFWLQGTFAFWSPPVHGQNPDSIKVGMQPISTKPPGAVTDLLASANPAVQGQISVSWTAPQGNAGGTPINNQTVASYAVGYATFSVDSLGGNTTTWWTHPGVTQTVLSPPGYTPQPPGSLEGTTFTGLLPGVTYYFALRSTSQGNVLSPIDTEAATPGQQARAVSTSLIPGAPTTFIGTGLSATSLQWSWSSVPGATSYLIYSQPGHVLLQTLSSPTTYWTETALSTNTTYTRVIYSSSSYGISLGSNQDTRSTLAAIPLGLTVTGATPSTADLSWTDGGNPTGTLYSLERSLDGVIFSALTPAVSTTTASDSGLSGNTTYFYRVQAFNNDAIGSPYSLTASTQTPPSLVVPAKPNGLLVSRRGSAFSFEWHAVQEGVTGQAVTISQYRIDRYTAIESSAPNLTVYVPATTLTYTEAINLSTKYYRVTALAVGGGVSDPSDFVDSSAAGNRYTLAPDDIATRVVVPAAMATELRKENNIYGEDLELRFVRRSQDETDTTLRSYNIGAYIARTGSEIFNFAFSKPLISVQMGYGAALGISQTLAIHNMADRANAGSIAQIIAVYWYNGHNFLRISDPILTSSDALSVNVRALGTYQVRAARISNSFALSQGSPYPRVITPNGAENRKVFFFFDNPTDSEVIGTIYDIRGAKVRELHVDGQSPTTTSLVWDGHDSNGSVVPSGVYLYKITAGDAKVTGSLVVAR